MLPDRSVKVVADLHLDAYHNDEDETEVLCFSETKKETTAFQPNAPRTRAQ